MVEAVENEIAANRSDAQHEGGREDDTDEQQIDTLASTDHLNEDDKRDTNVSSLEFVLLSLFTMIMTFFSFHRLVFHKERSRFTVQLTCLLDVLVSLLPMLLLQLSNNQRFESQKQEHPFLADLCMWLGIISLMGTLLFEAPLRQLVSPPSEYTLISQDALEGKKDEEPESSDSSSDDEDEEPAEPDISITDQNKK